MSDISLSQYKQQLLSVEDAIKTATGDSKVELIDLRNKLFEVITLLQGGVNESVSAKNDSKESSHGNIDDEFLQFQKEINQLETADKDESKCDQNVHDELCKVLSSMEGNKCRAPFRSQRGEIGYHNAIIFSTDLEDDIDDIQDVMVKVMFCNPVCEEMRPCPYFLDGHCKFHDNRCRYSHGYSIKYSDLEEYILPDYSDVDRDSRCLVKHEDGLWHTAVVEHYLGDHKYFVKDSDSGDTITVDAHDLLPLNQLALSDDDTSSSESSSSESESVAEFRSPNGASCYASNEINYSVQVGSSAMGEWEQHTTGIGSKLMAKMGYVWGEGLGKNSDGRIEPVEAIIFPKGKSLDKCAELRSVSGPESVEDRFKAEQVKQEERIKKMENTHESSIFTFLNQNVGRNSRELIRTELPKKRPSSDQASNSNKTQGTDLNFEMYSVGEDIKKTKKEIIKLQQSLQRNAERNEAACAQMKQKMTVQTGILRNLEAKEQRIGEEINKKKNHKKIAIF
nr:zinc finger CCCH-type with G patch domain-containing protein isoform X2 [Parasteatoda tepidariorum]